MSLPDLEEVWGFLRDHPTLESASSVRQGLTYEGRDLPHGAVTYAAEHFAGARLGFVTVDRGLLLHELPGERWMSLEEGLIRRTLSGAIVGKPQVLLNYAPASRGPWRLKALIDRQGHPVTSRFITVRPIGDSISLETLWALLNGPIANAYAYSHLGKRDNIVGDIRRIPIPKKLVSVTLEAAVAAYWDAFSNRLLLTIDAEVLNLYDLPLELEQQVLDVFTESKRVGVPFAQTRYLPATLEKKISLWRFVEMEQSWLAVNKERGQLIDKDIAGTITAAERLRLDILQTYADYHLQKVSPRPMAMLDELERRLGSREGISSGRLRVPGTAAPKANLHFDVSIASIVSSGILAAARST